MLSSAVSPTFAGSSVGRAARFKAWYCVLVKPSPSADSRDCLRRDTFSASNQETIIEILFHRTGRPFPPSSSRSFYFAHQKRLAHRGLIISYCRNGLRLNCPAPPPPPHYGLSAFHLSWGAFLAGPRRFNLRAALRCCRFTPFGARWTGPQLRCHNCVEHPPCYFFCPGRL